MSRLLCDPPTKPKHQHASASTIWVNASATHQHQLLCTFTPTRIVGSNIGKLGLLSICRASTYPIKKQKSLGHGHFRCGPHHYKPIYHIQTLSSWLPLYFQASKYDKCYFFYNLSFISISIFFFKFTIKLLEQ